MYPEPKDCNEMFLYMIFILFLLPVPITKPHFEDKFQVRKSSMSSMSSISLMSSAVFLLNVCDRRVQVSVEDLE